MDHVTKNKSHERREESQVAERLRDVLKNRGVSVRRFQLLLRDLGEREVSLPTVQRYVGGSVEAPLHFIVSASRVLGVRSSWLAFGEGAPTETAERERQMRERLQPSRRRAASAAIGEAWNSWEQLDTATRVSMLDTWDVHVMLRSVDVTPLGEKIETDQDEQMQTAKKIGQMLAIGNSVLSPARVPSQLQLTAYVLGVSSALRSLLVGKKEKSLGKGSRPEEEEEA